MKRYEVVKVDSTYEIYKDGKLFTDNPSYIEYMLNSHPRLIDSISKIYQLVEGPKLNVGGDEVEAVRVRMEEFKKMREEKHVWTSKLDTYGNTRWYLNGEFVLHQCLKNDKIMWSSFSSSFYEESLEKAKQLIIEYRERKISK